jgi:hypothetical protein
MAIGMASGCATTGPTTATISPVIVSTAIIKFSNLRLGNIGISPEKIFEVLNAGLG